MRKRVASLALVLAMAFGITLAVQSPALATSYYGCPNGVACFWVDAGGGGSRLTLPISFYTPGACWSLAHNGGFWNTITTASIDYGNGWDIRMYDSDNCTITNTFSYQNLYNPPSHSTVYTGALAWWNDRTSSFKILHL